MGTLPQSLICLKFSDSATETYAKLQKALVDESMSRAQSFCWYNIFTEGRADIKDERRRRRPTTSRTDETKKGLKNWYD